MSNYSYSVYIYPHPDSRDDKEDAKHIGGGDSNHLVREIGERYVRKMIKEHNHVFAFFMIIDNKVPDKHGNLRRCNLAWVQGTFTPQSHKDIWRAIDKLLEPKEKVGISMTSEEVIDRFSLMEIE